LGKRKISKPVMSVEKRRTPNVSFDPFFSCSAYFYSIIEGVYRCGNEKEEHESDKNAEQHEDIMMGKKQ